MSRTKALYEQATGKKYTPEQWAKIEAANAKQPGAPTARAPEDYAGSELMARSGRDGEMVPVPREKGDGAKFYGPDGKWHSVPKGLAGVEAREARTGELSKQQFGGANAAEPMSQLEFLRAELGGPEYKPPAPPVTIPTQVVTNSGGESKQWVPGQGGAEQPLASGMKVQPSDKGVAKIGGSAAGAMMEEPNYNTHWMGDEITSKYQSGMSGRSYDIANPRYKYGESDIVGDEISSKPSFATAVSAKKGAWDAGTEQQFQQWYAARAQKLGLSPNPDDPNHHYDYRAAFRAGAEPGSDGHWDSRFKAPDHPNRFVNGYDTITGKKIQ